jgi:hypothetical protein
MFVTHAQYALAFWLCVGYNICCVSFFTCFRGVRKFLICTYSRVNSIYMHANVNFSLICSQTAILLCMYVCMLRPFCMNACRLSDFLCTLEYTKDIRYLWNFAFGVDENVRSIYQRMRVLRGNF